MQCLVSCNLANIKLPNNVKTFLQISTYFVWSFVTFHIFWKFDTILQTIQTYGGIDILVSNAAANPYFGLMLQVWLSSLFVYQYNNNSILRVLYLINSLAPMTRSSGSHYQPLLHSGDNGYWGLLIVDRGPLIKHNIWK